jgi:hypothetical protein
MASPRHLGRPARTEERQTRVPGSGQLPQTYSGRRQIPPPPPALAIRATTGEGEALGRARSRHLDTQLVSNDWAKSPLPAHDRLSYLPYLLRRPSLLHLRPAKPPDRSRGWPSSAHVASKEKTRERWEGRGESSYTAQGPWASPMPTIGGSSGDGRPAQ